jgi:hypothetical protein
MALTPADIVKVKSYINVYDVTFLTDPNLDFVIGDSADNLSASFYGTKYPKAVAFLTMHTLSVAKGTVNGGGADGFLSEKTIGPVKVKYAQFNGKGRNSALLMTKYGVMLDDLTKSCGPGISVNNMWGIADASR